MLSIIYKFFSVSTLDPIYKIHLDWSETRSIQLEDVDLPPGSLLVGLGFNKTSLNGVNRIRLTALGIKFNVNLGLINSNSSSIYLGEEIDFTKPTIDVHEHLLPMNTSNNVVVTNSSVSFDISDMKTDLGQTTIPFIDIQDVTTKLPTVMGGAGLYYKYSGDVSRQAGYIGLKLKTYDFVPHINFD